MKDDKDLESIEIKNLETDALDMVSGGKFIDMTDPTNHLMYYEDLLMKISILKRDNPGITREEAIQRAVKQVYLQTGDVLLGVVYWMTEEKWETL